MTTYKHNTMLNYSNYDNPESLAKELVQHFAESMAPIEVEFNSMSEMEPFSLAIDKIEGASNLGGKFLCKKAGQGMGSSYRASEIMQFGESSYPLTITFAKRNQLGAFAYGYVDAYKIKEDNATWEQMVAEGLIKREDLEEAKASIADFKQQFPHTKVVDAKSYRAMTVASREAEAQGDVLKQELLVCRYLRGFDADSILKAKQIYEQKHLGVITEAEADIEIDKIESELYPNTSSDPLDRITEEYAKEVVNADALANNGVISQAEAERRKEDAFGKMVEKATEEKMKKNRIWYWLIGLAIFIIIKLLIDNVF